MQTLDYLILALYPVVLLTLGFMRRIRKGTTAADLIVGGRSLTLPAFVATLVSTWYGGILGVGEYTYLYGISNWLVFGLPYYLAAMIFAYFIAGKARSSEVLTIPDRLQSAYGNRVAMVGSVLIFLMSVPAAYVLMLGVLCETFFGWPFALSLFVVTLFSVVYVFMGGFRAVVRTDLMQFVLMFTGFAVLLVVLVFKYGGWEFLSTRLPADHLSWHGGNSVWFIAVWYVIALGTLVEPTFYQRCYAAKSPQIARRGIMISIGCWAVFDFMTTSCGLYARAILTDLGDPVASFPTLALEVLPPGLLGLFGLALLATVMSTVDSYSFVAATTFGHDIVARFKRLSDNELIMFSRVGLILSTTLALLFALLFRSAIGIWHAFGSIGTPALLLPVVLAFTGKHHLSESKVLLLMILSGLVAGGWYISKLFTPEGNFWFGLEPIFVGLGFSLALLFILKRVESETLPER